MTNQEAIGILELVVETAKGRCFVTDEAISDAYGMAIKALEAQEWVPCKERLPEDSGRYLISVLDGIGRRTTVTSYQPRYKAWTMTGRMAYWKVLAWKPLPEPYREDGE